MNQQNDSNRLRNLYKVTYLKLMDPRQFLSNFGNFAISPVTFDLHMKTWELVKNFRAAG